MYQRHAKLKNKFHKLKPAKKKGIFSMENVLKKKEKGMLFICGYLVIDEIPIYNLILISLSFIMKYGT